MNGAYLVGYQAGYADGQADAGKGINQMIPNGDISCWPIPCMSLGTRARNCLLWAGYQRIGDITALSEDQIRATRGLGPKTADEIARALVLLGIRYSEWNKFLLDE